MPRSISAGGAVVAALAAAAWWLPELRRGLMFDVTWWDAKPSEPAELPSAIGAGLAPTPRTRVVLIDGLTAEVAPALRAWSRICERGIDVTVDVGFPTISLPVEVALWTGLTQQQTGIVSRNGGRGGSYGRPLDPPLDRRGIPAQIAGSIAVAEDHGWIVRSLGFSRAEPPADPADAAVDANASGWKGRWQGAALEAVASGSPLVFVHILRVDTTGHGHGVGSAYVAAAVESDLVLERLVAADPGARWFVLSDHGHIAGGGHGGEERDVRQVRACIAGPGVAPAIGSPVVHVVDVARALADSTGATLDASSRGRPIAAARAAPLSAEQAVPPIALGPGAIALVVVIAGLAGSLWAARRWWLVPWWFIAACASLYAIRGEPTLSTGWLYKPEGRDMYLTWLPALAIALATTWIGLARPISLGRVVVAQLGFPVLATAAAITACGAWPVVFGAEFAPVVPRYTAWMLALVLMVAHGAGAVALGVLATLVRRAFDRRAPEAPPRSARAADA